MRKTLLAVALLLTGVWLYPPARFAFLVAVGRGANCSYSRAIQSATELKNQLQIKNEILGSTRLIETDPAGFKKYKTPMGDYWIPAGSEFVLPYNLAEIRRSIYFEDGHTIQKGDIVLDCGANVGVFTRQALNMGAARVIAIEPAPENLECLRRNFSQEISDGRVVIYPKGVWDRDAQLDLHVDPKNSAADSFVMNSKATHIVPRIALTTIDKLIGELDLHKVDFIKMDIEGAELRALDGASATLKEYKPRISISAYHEADHPMLIPEKIQSAHEGYQMSCGPCTEIPFGVRPDILYFQ